MSQPKTSRYLGLIGFLCQGLCLAGCGLGSVGADLEAWRAAKDAFGADATVAADAGADASTACSPANCDDDNPCTADTCKAGACLHATQDGPCDDGSGCTGADTCKEGKCQGAARTWMFVSGIPGAFQTVAAVRELPDGGVLAVGATQFGDGDAVPARGHTLRLDAAGKSVGEWQTDPDTRWTALVPVPAATLLLGFRCDGASVALISAPLPLDAVQPPALVTQDAWPDQPIAAEPSADQTVLVLAQSGTEAKRHVVLDRLHADGSAVARTPVLGTEGLQVQGWTPNAAGHLLVGSANDGQSAWAAQVSPAGVLQGKPAIYTCPQGTDHHLVGAVPAAFGFVLVGHCQTAGAAHVWLVGVDRKAKPLWTKVYQDQADTILAVRALSATTWLAAGYTHGNANALLRPALWQFDVTGQQLWSRTIEKGALFASLTLAQDGGIWLGGAATQGMTLTAADSFVVRANAWGLTDCKGAGKCAGPGNSCDDGDPCTSDVCVLAGACTNTQNTWPCNDGVACAIGETCQGGACQGGKADLCDDENACTTDSCSDPEGCKHKPASGSCSDGNACTTGDLCIDTTCTPNGVLACDDGNPCTTDVCDPGVGCNGLNVPDGLPCAQGKVCAAGKCSIPWASAVATGDDFSCAMHDGHLLCWGANDRGQLGNGVGAASGIPVDTGVVQAVQVGGGVGFACARKATGKIACWGRNDVGQAGVVPGPGAATPTDVALAAVAVDLAVGATHACARTVQQDVWCWGSNIDKQLDKDGAGSFAPVQPAHVTKATLIAAGGAQTCALKPNGETVCWGLAKLGGALFEKTTSQPQLIDLPASPVALAVGETFACALMNDHSVWCWGENSVGQLGMGKSVPGTFAPVAVLGLQDAESVTAGFQHACVLRKGGAVWCWGDHVWGELGDSTALAGISVLESPILASIQPMTQLAARNTHTCGLLPSGAVACWGHGGLPGLVGQSKALVYLQDSLP